MLVPKGPVVKRCVDLCAVIHIVECAYPREPERVFSLIELPDCDRTQLLKRFWEIAIKVQAKLFTLSLLDGIPAKLDHLKIGQVLYALHPVLPGWRVSLAGTRATNDKQSEQWNQET